MKKIFSWGVFFVFFGIAVANSQNTTTVVRVDERDEAYRRIAQFTKVLEQVRAGYVDPSATDYKKLIYGAMQGMLATLDSYSQFLDPDTYTAMQDDTDGLFGGLGVFMGSSDGFLIVVAPMEDSPGFRAGLLPGDRLVEIDGESTKGMTLQGAVRRLKGEPGTEVVIKVYRPKAQETKEFKIMREVIEIASVKNVQMLDEQVGFIRITQFSEPTAQGVQEGMELLRREGMKALVVDLRNNPGGLLGAAVAVSEKFLPKDAVVVSTRGRLPDDDQTLKAGGRNHYLDFPMILLVNGSSASAAEIMCGALQDHHRAVILGEKTYGKGSVQTVVALDDGSAIKLTTARYFTPAGRMIHEKGIEPDIVVPLAPEEYGQILFKARKKTASAEAVEEDDEKLAKDIQLERAVDLLHGLLVWERK